MNTNTVIIAVANAERALIYELYTQKRKVKKIREVQQEKANYSDNEGLFGIRVAGGIQKNVPPKKEEKKKEHDDMSFFHQWKNSLLRIVDQSSYQSLYIFLPEYMKEEASDIASQVSSISVYYGPGNYVHAGAKKLISLYKSFSEPIHRIAT